MMLAIKLPVWLVNIWAAYSDVIVPALVTLSVALITWIAMKLKADAKVNQTKAELQIQELKKLNDREDTRPELTKVHEELEEVKLSNRYLAEMFDLVFQNSTIDENTKNSLTILKNKLLFGVDENLVLQLTEEKEALTQQVDALTKKLEETVTVVTQETRTRR